MKQVLRDPVLCAGMIRRAEVIRDGLREEARENYDPSKVDAGHVIDELLAAVRSILQQQDSTTPPIDLQELERALENPDLKSDTGRFLAMDHAKSVLWRHRDRLLFLAKLALLVREGGEEAIKAVILAELARQTIVSGSDVYLYDEQTGVVDIDGSFRPIEIASAIVGTLEGLIK